MQYSDEELHIDISNISLIISEYEQFKLSLLLFTISSIMDEILTLFNDIQTIVEDISTKTFENEKIVNYKVRKGTEAEAEILKPLVNKRVSVQQRRVEDIFNELEQVVNQYKLFDHIPKVQALKAQYTGLTTAIKSLNDSISNYTGSNRMNTIEERYRNHDNTFQHEEDGLQAEIESITQSIAQLKIQYENLQCENNDLANEIANVDVLTEECTQSRKEIASLQVEIEQKRSQLNEIDNQIYECKTLYTNDLLNNPFEVEDIQKMILSSKEEQQSLLADIDQLKVKISKQKDLQMKMRTSHPDLQSLSSQLQKDEQLLEDLRSKRDQSIQQQNAIKTLCAHLLNESNTPTSIAMKIVHENGGSIPLNQLKKKLEEVVDSSKILNIIYTLVGQSLLKIDRSQSENLVVSLIY